jgi:hypothetical protein
MAYNLVLDTKKQYGDYFWFVNIFDFSIRLILLTTAVILSLPMIQKTSMRSGEVLLQMSKISQTNISFYMQHYNKLSLFVKSSEPSSKTIDRVEQFYTSEFRMKKIKEQISGFNRGGRFAKLGKTDKYKLLIYGLLFILLFMACQIGGFIQFMITGVELNQKVRFKIKFLF